MKLLHANDRRGEHAPSWYAATTTSVQRPSLERNIDADVCVIGAGYSGLSAAREIARRGLSVVVLEAHRVGWGASGRNGGQLGSGFNLFQRELETLVGESRAKALWEIAETGKRLVRELAGQPGTDLQYRPGIIVAAHRANGVTPLHEEAAYLARHYGYTSVEPLDHARIRELIATNDYHGGVLDMGSAHVHPLRLAQALGDAAEQHGATVYECSEVLRIDGLEDGASLQRRPRVITASGSVQAEHIVLAANGYLDGLVATVNESVMPINNFILVTEPLGERGQALLPGNHAVSDSRFVVNYFRRTPDDRLLFGGGESYGYRFPTDMSRRSRRAMLEIFPDLADVKIDFAWGGTLAITAHRLPHVMRPTPRLTHAGGYSGHGVGLALATGEAIGAALDGDDDALTLLEALPTMRFPGGQRTRSSLLAIAMTLARWRDRF